MGYFVEKLLVFIRFKRVFIESYIQETQKTDCKSLTYEAKKVQALTSEFMFSYLW